MKKTNGKKDEFDAKHRKIPDHDKWKNKREEKHATTTVAFSSTRSII